MSDEGERSEYLLRQANQGNAEALEGLLRMHEPSLLAFLRVKAGPALGGRESARDILQDILLQVVEGIAKFEYRGEAQFRGWLYTLAENRLRERARHHRRAKRDLRNEKPLSSASRMHAKTLEGFSAFGEPVRELQRREALEQIEAAFDKLSATDREILSLSALCGMSASEIARKLGLEVETVRKRRTRARARLAALWGRADDAT